MATIRLERKTEKKIGEVAKKLDQTKSFIIKEALVMYLERYEKAATPFTAGEDLFGRYGSGKGNLSRDRKKLLTKKLRAKVSH